MHNVLIFSWITRTLRTSYICCASVKVCSLCLVIMVFHRQCFAIMRTNCWWQGFFLDELMYCCYFFIFYFGITSLPFFLFLFLRGFTKCNHLCDWLGSQSVEGVYSCGRVSTAVISTALGVVFLQQSMFQSKTSSNKLVSRNYKWTTWIMIGYEIPSKHSDSQLCQRG